MANHLRCTLCLKLIDEENEETVIINGRLRHKECSDTLEEMIKDLEKIDEDNLDPDI